jgi:tetratricopeptide (TPR) repeat protein
MWFAILGPLLVGDGDSVTSVSAGRQRVLLAALLVRAGTVVSADALADFVWDGSPPGRAETTLRSHVMRLRRALGPAAGGNYAQATDYQLQALRTSRETGNRLGEVHALGNLGRLDLRQGHFAQAADRHREALALSRETGDQVAEVEALNGLGEVMLAIGPLDDARAHHVSALRLASQIGAKHEQAHAHRGLAQACDAMGDPDQARRHWRHALSLFTELGAPEADQIRARLAANDSTRKEPPLVR